MAGIVAYKERETALGTHLRDEWRIKPFAAYTQEEVVAWLGPRWFSSSYYRNPRFILEHRYIRDGVDEGWKPFDLFPTREAALEHIDSGATTVGEGLAKVQRKRTAEFERAEKERLAKIAMEDEARERRDKQMRSEAAFSRLGTSSSKNAALAEQYNTFIREHGNNPSLRTAILADRSLYDAVINAETIPTKVRAIRAFLKRYANAGAGKRRHGGAPSVGKLVHEVGSMLRR